MDSNAYVEELERRCGKSAAVFFDASAQDGPQIGIIGFDNYPVAGEYTYFSYGLHRLEKPEWTHGVPEYFIVIDCPNRSFASYFGYLISEFGFEKTMAWNTLLGVGEEDAIDGYPYRWVAFASPEYLDWDDYIIVPKAGLPIHLGMGYFISNNDFQTVRERGISFLNEKTEVDYEYWKRIQKA